MALGAALGLIGGVGIARFRTTLSRTHAASKPASIGMVLVALGAGVSAESWGLVAVAAAIGLFQFATAPIAGHMIGRASVGLPEEGPETALIAVAISPLAMAAQTSLLWAALWRDASPGVLLAGAFIGAVLAMLIRGKRSGPPLSLGVFGTLSRYVLSLVRSNLRTALQVIRMSPADTAETIVWCELETRSVRTAVFTANATTFTPGTLTVEMSNSIPFKIAVHALGMSDDEVREEVSRLERDARRMYRGRDMRQTGQKPSGLAS
jgi:multicomponent Na+:H+ antiporter subunit G